MIKKIYNTEIAIVGAGPIGLTASLLLQKFKINYLVFQKNQKFRSHPSAHWINVRSKEILREIDGLNEKIQSEQQDWKYVSHFRHVQKILGKNLGQFNHFSPSIQEKLLSLRQHTLEKPSNLNQMKLTSILYDTVKNKENLILNTQITNILKNQKDGVILEGLEQGNKIQIHSKYVVGCDGFHSSIRSNLGIGLQGDKKLLKCINIHFESKKLANLIDKFNQNAMLHFIYNANFVSILVNHSKKQGIFVLQIPNYEPFYDLLSDHTPLQLIHKAIQQNQIAKLDDIKVINVGRWIVSSQISKNYLKNNIFLAGDAAHSFPPAGGFGMNTGFQDIHNLIHKFHILYQNPRIQPQKLLSVYEQQRKEVGSKFMKLAKKGFQISLDISKELGLNPDYKEYLDKLSFLPFKSSLFNIGTKLLFHPKPITKHIRLFYDQEFHFAKYSKIRTEFLKKPHILYIRNSKYPSQEFKELNGIQQKYVEQMELPQNQKLVRCDGIVLY